MFRKALLLTAVAGGAMGLATPAGALDRPQIIWGPGGVAITVPSTCPAGAYVPCSWLGYMNEPNVPKTVGLGPIPPGFTFDINYPNFCGVLQADALYRVNQTTPFYALGGYWELSYGTRDFVTNCTPPTTTTTEPSTTTTTGSTTTTTSTSTTTMPVNPPTTTSPSTGCLIHGSTDSGTNCPVVTPPSTYTSTPPTMAPAVSISPPKPPRPQTVVDGAPIAATAPQLPYTGVPVARLLVIGGGLIALGVVLLKTKLRRNP